MTHVKIIGADGNVYGPITSDQLCEWVRQGRANAQTRVLPEGATEWTELGELPEFEEVLGRKPGNLPASGAYSVVPANLLERDYPLDLGTCLRRAVELLQAHFGIIFGVTAIYLLIQSAIQGLASIPYIGVLFSFGSIFVVAQVQAGAYLVILRTARGETADVGEMFAGFKFGYAQLLLTSLVRGLLTGLAALPGMILMGVPIVAMLVQGEASVLLVLLSVLGFLLMLIPLTYLTTVWVFSLPLVIDKGLGFWQAMETSRKVVNKHWFTVFALLLIVGLINLVGLGLCCVGLFLSVPVGFTVLMSAYETLFSSHEVEPI
jgi:hypothetical protein